MIVRNDVSDSWGRVRGEGWEEIFFVSEFPIDISASKSNEQLPRPDFYVKKSLKHTTLQKAVGAGLV